MPDSYPEEDEEYVLVKISYVGFADQLGLEGIVILKTFEGREFPMRAFSGEVARHISRFQEGDKNTIPTIYNLVEEIAVMQDLLLTEVKVYQKRLGLTGKLIFQRKERLSSIAKLSRFRLYCISSLL